MLGMIDIEGIAEPLLVGDVDEEGTSDMTNVGWAVEGAGGANCCVGIF